MVKSIDYGGRNHRACNRYSMACIFTTVSFDLTLVQESLTHSMGRLIGGFAIGCVHNVVFCEERHTYPASVNAVMCAIPSENVIVVAPVPLYNLRNN